MSKRLRKRSGCPPAVAVLAILWMLAPFLAACGATPEEMTVDQAERVEVRISMDTAAALTEGLKGEGTPVVESIPVSYFIKSGWWARPLPSWPSARRNRSCPPRALPSGPGM